MHTFDTAAPVTVVLDIPAGRVRFIAADRADTTVEVLPANADKRRDVAAAGQTTVDYADGVLRIETPSNNQVLGSSGSVEVTVQLPAGSRVGAKAASAELRGVGRLGEVTFEGAHGAITLDEVAAARLTTQSGDVTIGRLTGAAEIRTGKGDIRVTEAARGAVVLRTEAGNVSIDAAHGVSASLNAGTGYGRIDNALRNHDGAPELTIHATTGYGDITAHSR